MDAAEFWFPDADDELEEPSKPLVSSITKASQEWWGGEIGGRKRAGKKATEEHGRGERRVQRQICTRRTESSYQNLCASASSHATKSSHVICQTSE